MSFVASLCSPKYGLERQKEMRTSSATNSYSTSSWSISWSFFDAAALLRFFAGPWTPCSDGPSCFDSADLRSLMRCSRTAFVLSAFALMNMLHMTSKRRSLVSSCVSLTRSLNSDIVISTASSAVVEPPIDLE